MKQSIKNHLK